MTLKTADFDYDLDPKWIAQQPVEPRDASRLMVLRRSDGSRRHHIFRDLPDLLNPGDLLVLNDTRVIPAGFTCRRRSGGRIGGMFLRELGPGRWEVMLKGARQCRIGQQLSLTGSGGTRLELIERLGEGRWNVGVEPAAPAVEILQQVGSTPLPPYIRREDRSREPADRAHYQTIYASKPGAVAAPTAGLHFTRRVLDRLAERGIELTWVTLHVGLGTFAPVKCEDLCEHVMHGEWFELTGEAAGKIAVARQSGRRIVAVGSTSVRVLESAARLCGGSLAGVSGWTSLFLYPPAEFRMTDAMITNFHLRRSTLLMLVAAFCSPGATTGVQMILAAYAEAGRLGYRFYSYGDAMLIE